MKRNPIQNPTKKVLLIYLISWVVGDGLILYIMTDGFQQRVFQSRNVPFGLLFLFSTFSTFKVVRNYFRSKQT